MIQETLIDVAEAVVEALQAGVDAEAFSDLFAPELLLNTELKIEDASRLHVGIVPGRVAQVLQDRGLREGDFTVDIAVRRIVNPNDLDAVKAIFRVQREIDDYLFHLGEDAGHRLPTFQDAVWASADLKWPYVPEMLRSHNQFTGICWVTYHVFDLT